MPLNVPASVHPEWTGVLGWIQKLWLWIVRAVGRPVWATKDELPAGTHVIDLFPNPKQYLLFTTKEGPEAIDFGPPGVGRRPV